MKVNFIKNDEWKAMVRGFLLNLLLLFAYYCLSNRSYLFSFVMFACILYVINSKISNVEFFFNFIAYANTQLKFGLRLDTVVQGRASWILFFARINQLLKRKIWVLFEIEAWINLSVAFRAKEDYNNGTNQTIISGTLA